MIFSKLDWRFLFFLLLAVVISSAFAFYIMGDNLSNPYVVQDDFRQTNFWFWHFWDKSIFTDDLFTNNYKVAFNLAPLYLLSFKIAPLFTDDLIGFSKNYSLVLATLTGVAAFLFYSEESKKKYLESLIFSSFIAFIVWTTDHLSAAHIRSSIWLILFLYLFAKCKKSDILAGLLCSISLFFNPSAFLLIYFSEFVGVFLDLKFKIQDYFKKYFSTVSFLVLNALITLSYHFLIRGGVSYLGEGHRFSCAEMKSLAEFNPGGRHPVFGANLWDDFGYSWWMSEHWGIGIGYLKISKIFILAVVVLLAYLIVKIFVKKNFDKSILVSPCLVLFYSAVTLNILAQIIFPNLYMPSRFLAIPLLLLSCFLIFKIFAILFVFFAKELKAREIKVSQVWLKNIFLIALVAIIIWFFKDAIHPRFVSVNPQLVALVAKLDKQAMIAGHPLLADINSLSIFSKRKIYVDYERSISYTKSTLQEIRKRNLIAIKMTYATTKEEFLALAQQEGITHFLALRDLYNYRNLQNARYINPYNQFLKQTILQAKGQFFLAQYLDQIKQQYALIDIASLVNSAS